MLFSINTRSDPGEDRQQEHHYLEQTEEPECTEPADDSTDLPSIEKVGDGQYYEDGYH